MQTSADEKRGSSDLLGIMGNHWTGTMTTAGLQVELDYLKSSFQENRH